MVTPCNDVVVPCFHSGCHDKKKLRWAMPAGLLSTLPTASGLAIPDCPKAIPAIDHNDLLDASILWLIMGVMRHPIRAHTQ
ncbi:hypothetical protein EBZ35_02285, partial [bacterium]|nr:hypothetical protein [bacterium]